MLPEPCKFNNVPNASVLLAPVRKNDHLPSCQMSNSDSLGAVVYYVPPLPDNTSRHDTAVPDWLTLLLKRLKEDTGQFDKDLNHVLINEYNPGEGIMVRAAATHRERTRRPTWMPP